MQNNTNYVNNTTYVKWTTSDKGVHYLKEVTTGKTVATFEGEGAIFGQLIPWLKDHPEYELDVSAEMLELEKEEGGQ